ncbi:transcriptional regulator, LuxR family, putative [Cyanobium sp. PCC 7001]|uniref:response regulator transcription factor n=1 Tax=Cyanobium sp. PCC 7001 TaxID=180281 RepID=UPI00018052E6|nr:helix-turn-helix transcriptional regulator [Cyanobium sp. PCC 7001]EDY38095.1 transcriptional regulator, LuxR family, putative [Cyanobium sp. PCC 7001]
MAQPLSSSPGSTSSALALRPVATPAEARVLGLVCRGHSNRDIATALVVSVRTVESHISSLLAKTGCRNRTQLLIWALTAE